MLGMYFPIKVIDRLQNLESEGWLTAVLAELNNIHCSCHSLDTGGSDVMETRSHLRQEKQCPRRNNYYENIYIQRNVQLNIPCEFHPTLTPSSCSLYTSVLYLPFSLSFSLSLKSETSSGHSVPENIFQYK